MSYIDERGFEGGLKNGESCYSWLVEDFEDEKIFSRVNQIKEKYKNKREKQAQVSYNKQNVVNSQPQKSDRKERENQQSKGNTNRKRRFCYSTDNQACENNSSLINHTKENNIQDICLLQSRVSRSHRPSAGLIKQKQPHQSTTISSSSPSNTLPSQPNSELLLSPKHSSSIKQHLTSFLSIDFTEKPETKRLLDLICTQIQYDKEFRRGKECFNKMVDAGKFEEVRGLLLQRGVAMSTEEIKQTFKLQESQFNPFSHPQTSLSLRQICSLYLQSSLHYHTNLHHKLNLSLLTHENFFTLLNNSFSISTFVSLLNCIYNSHYRNRDLIIFFNRLPAINIENFLYQLSL